MSSESPTIVAAAAGFAEDAFNAFLRERDDPAWLVDRRREAFVRLKTFAFPSAMDEEWRRTDIRALKIGGFATPAAGGPSTSDREQFEIIWKNSSAHYGT